MTTFTGTNFGDAADTSDFLNVGGTLAGFTGGTLAQLKDATGDVINGLGGNDFIYAGSGDDIIDAGSATPDINGNGFDLVVGGDGADTITVTAGNAATTIVIYAFESGGGGVNVNLGADGAVDTFGKTDVLNGVTFVVATNQNDTLTGDTTNDTLAPGRGTDTVTGGGGTDILAYYFISGGGDGFNYTAGITVTITADDTGTVSSTDGVSTTFTQMEIIAGTRFADTFNGSAADDWFMGGQGADGFNGSGGTDTADYTLDAVGGGFAGVTVNLATGNATDGFGDSDTLSSIENVIGTRFGDTLTGNAGVNVLDGGAGNDTLNGGVGNDTLKGGAGNDTYIIDAGDTLIDSSGTDTIKAAFTVTLAAAFENLTLTGAGAINGTGNGSANTLIGTSGNNALSGLGGFDILTGGNGRDMLTGGLGKDYFDFNALAESRKGALRDQILDFSHSQGDKIDLLTIDAKAHTGGNQSFKFIGTHAFGHHDGELRYSAHVLQGDVNGDGKADFEIHVNAVSLKATDFIL